MENLMKICLSFDDGRSDAFEAYKILKKYNLRASFHITTGFIDNSYISDSFGQGRRPLKIDEISEMYKNDMDISSHGDKHVMENNDFLVSYSKLFNWCKIKNNNETIGFSVPNSLYDDNRLSEFVLNNKNKLSYIRVGRHPNCYSIISKMNYVLYHIFHLHLFFRIFNKHNLIKAEDVNRYNLFSLVIKKDTRVRDIIRLIDENKNRDKVLVLMFHSIVEHPMDEWEYSIEDFSKLCEYLRKHVKVKTLKELVE